MEYAVTYVGPGLRENFVEWRGGETETVRGDDLTWTQTPPTVTTLPTFISTSSDFLAYRSEAKTTTYLLTLLECSAAWTAW